MNTSPPSKPMACAIRRRTLRPFTLWRASQRSKAQLKTMFQTMAMAEAATATTPEWPALCPATRASPAVAAAMAMSSYSAT